jgi:hypothetical protein
MTLSAITHTIVRRSIGCAGVGFLLATLTVAGDVQAGPRYGLFVGSNRAPPGLPPLRYTHIDANKVHDVFVELGGLPTDNATLLLDPRPDEIQRALIELREHAQSGEEQLLFYYSGHADDSTLLLGSEELPFDVIQEFLADTRARVRLALVDSCRSGALSQVKGGSHELGVNISWTVEQPVQGAVLITSSAAEEVSIERDDIGSSLFSHFFVSGLRGAADLNDDGKVTLEEAFDYSYGHTLARSTESRSGSQHPTYEYRITGRQQLVLSWLHLPSSLSFGEQLAGTYVVFDRADNRVVAELSKERGVHRSLWLPPGDYYIKKRMPSAVLLQKVGLTKGAEHEVHDYEMHTVPYEEDVTKGHLSEVFRPTWKYGAPFVYNTAHTFRRGEIAIGLFNLHYGLTDNVMLRTILIEDLVLAPNIHIKLRPVRTERLAWSVETGFKQSYLYRVAENADRSNIELRAETVLSWMVASPLTLSLIAGWRMESRPDHESGAEWENQVLVGGFSATWLLSEHDLVQLSGNWDITAVAPGRTDLAGNVEWGGTLIYAHSWDVFRLAFGVGRGAFITESLDIKSTYWPFVNLWWRW